MRVSGRHAEGQRPRPTRQIVVRLLLNSGNEITAEGLDGSLIEFSTSAEEPSSQAVGPRLTRSSLQERLLSQQPRKRLCQKHKRTAQARGLTSIDVGVHQ
jgi:hypothetical protein